MLFRALYISESEALDSIYSLLFTKLNGTLTESYGDTLQLDKAWLEIPID